MTPRKWDKKSEWCREKNRLPVWKEVRAYDSADLEEWLELARVVDLWFATIRGQRQPGVTALDEHWAGLAALSSPALTPKVFLTSREKGVEEVKKWLNGESSVLKLK